MKSSTKKATRVSLIMIVIGCLCVGAGFYELSVWKEGEGSIWGVVSFTTGGILAVWGIGRIIGYSPFNSNGGY